MRIRCPCCSQELRLPQRLGVMRVKMPELQKPVPVPAVMPQTASTPPFSPKLGKQFGPKKALGIGVRVRNNVNFLPWDGDQGAGRTSSNQMCSCWWVGRRVTAGGGSPNSPTTPTRIATAVRLARKASPLAWRKRQSHRPKGIDMGRTEAIKPLHEVRPRIDESDSNGR